MNGSPKTWWEDPQTDWTGGDPARAVDLLAHAYEERSAIRSLAEAAGLEWGRAPSSGAAREAWIWTLSEAARLGRDLDLVAAVLNDPGSTAFLAPLGALLGDRLGRANALRTDRYGLPAQGRDKVLESVVAVSTEPGEEPLTGLEAITSVSEGFGEPEALVQAIVDATRRTAMIEVAGQPRGTGFLVSNDLLLTAAHVLDARNWPPSSQQGVVAVFDYRSVPGRSPAETGTRVPVSGFVTGSLPTLDEVAGRAEIWNAPLDRLDFALLRLATPVPPSRDAGAWGGERGAYRMDGDDYDFGPSPLLLIVQHPLGQFKRYSFVKNRPEPSPRGTRVRYRGNTLQGSSGSPVVDVRGRLVAVHHYSQPGLNQGVPVSVIARTLQQDGFGELFSAAVDAAGPAPLGDAVVTVDPFLTQELMGRPFVNRKNLRDRIREMAVDKNSSMRTLAISGDSGTGVSYSYMFTSHVAAESTRCEALRAAAPEGLTAFPVDLRDYVGVGVEERQLRIANYILVNLEMVEPLEPLAQAARDVTTLRAWIATKLRKAPDRQWWIFFDSIDNLVEVNQGDVGELIHAMIAVADDPQVPLRVVLAGREARQFAEEHWSWLEKDTAVGLARGDVEDWFRARAAEERRAIDEGRLAAALARLFPDGGPLAEPKTLAPQLPTALLDLLDGAPDGP